MDDSRVVLGEILRPRGIKGELSVISLTDVPNRFTSLKNARVRLQNGADIDVEVVDAWPHKGEWVLKFKGVDSMDAAEVFKRSELWVPLSERGKLPDGQYFWSDLIGCQVVDEQQSEPIGIVTGFQDYGSAPLMQVQTDSKEVLVPFVEGIYRKVDLESKRILVDLPAGLLDL